MISRRRFVVSHHRKTSYRNPSEFQFFRIWKTFMHKRGISQFTVKIFWLRVPKNFVVELFCVSVSFWYREVLQIADNFHDFPSKVFALQVQKNRRSFFLCSRKVRYQEGFEITEGISRFSVGSILSHRTEKYREGFLLCCCECFLSEKFMTTTGEGGK